MVRTACGDGELRLEAGFEAVRGNYKDLIDLQFSPEWSLVREGVTDRWMVQTGFTLPVGERFPVAGCGKISGTEGWLLAATGNVESADGVSLDSLQLRETKQGEATVPWSESMVVMRKGVELPDGRSVRLDWFRDDVMRFGWEVESTRARERQMIDARIAFDVDLPEPPEGLAWSRRTAMTLRSGFDREDDAGKAPDGRELRFGLRSEMIGER